MILYLLLIYVIGLFKKSEIAKRSKMWFWNILKTRFLMLPQAFISNTDSETKNGHPMTLPSNLDPKNNSYLNCFET